MDLDTSYWSLPIVILTILSPFIEIMLVLAYAPVDEEVDEASEFGAQTASRIYVDC